MIAAAPSSSRAYGSITQDTSGRFVVDAEPHVALRLKRILGKIQKDAHGSIKLSQTPEVCRDLLWFVDRYPLAIAPPVRVALARGADQHRESILRLEQILAPGYVPPVMDLKLPLRDYQAREVAIYLAKGSLLNADDVGLGKTACGIGSFADPRTLPAVVVTLTHLPEQWRDEIRKFAPDLLVHIIRSGITYPLPTFMGRGPDVVIINYHKLAGWTDVFMPWAKSIIFDECQELRHAGTMKYTGARDLARAMPFRLGLSATPIYNYGGEIFNVLDVLHPGALGSFEEFCTEWCIGHGNKTRIKDPHAFGTYLREHFLMLRHTRKDVGRELPPVTRIPHRIDTDAAALDAITDAAGELARIILSQEKLDPFARMEAAQEFTTVLRQATGIAKAPHVADFVRLLVESGERVLLTGWHHAVYAIWMSKLADLKPVLYTGEQSIPQKREAKRAFMAGESQVLILSLRSGAGMNDLQDVCSVVVFGEIDYSPGVHEQVIGRVARDGQDVPVLAYFLLSDEGSDPAIAEINGIKREQIEGIRNPEQDLLERLDTSGDHVRRLAKAYLTQRGRGGDAS